MATVGTIGALRQPPPGSGIAGQGLAFPISYTTQGRLALAYGQTAVEQSLLTIATTGSGERVMLPGYGAREGEFEPFDMPRMVAKFKLDVANYEPRVEWAEIDTEYGPGVGETTATIRYQQRGDANERTLTFPIFQGPAT